MYLVPGLLPRRIVLRVAWVIALEGARSGVGGGTATRNLPSVTKREIPHLHSQRRPALLGKCAGQVQVSLPALATNDISCHREESVGRRRDLK
jgi:hypothetical protein